MFPFSDHSLCDCIPREYSIPEKVHDFSPALRACGCAEGFERQTNTRPFLVDFLSLKATGRSFFNFIYHAHGAEVRVRYSAFGNDCFTLLADTLAI